MMYVVQYLDFLKMLLVEISPSPNILKKGDVCFLPTFKDV